MEEKLREFGETEKSLQHELGSVLKILSLTSVFLVLYYHLCLLCKTLWIRVSFFLQIYFTSFVDSVDSTHNAYFSDLSDSLNSLNSLKVFTIPLHGFFQDKLSVWTPFCCNFLWGYKYFLWGHWYPVYLEKLAVAVVSRRKDDEISFAVDPKFPKKEVKGANTNQQVFPQTAWEWKKLDQKEDLTLPPPSSLHRQCWWQM